MWHLEAAADAGLARTGLECVGDLCDPFWVEGLRSASPTSPPLGRGQARQDPLAYERPLVLGKRPKIENSSSPYGVVVSICSVSERKATPRALRSATIASRWDSERPSRSSFQTTSTSPDLR